MRGNKQLVQVSMSAVGGMTLLQAAALADQVAYVELLLERG